ncbi:RNA dependent RNA polymerase-domain-containing protein [Mycena olivaceomarginata]|nr:RNA dependent RNA polymerase-domain-containing protein [Mycena olivaceomarginata]
MSQESDSGFDGVEDFANVDWDYAALDEVISPTKQPEDWRSPINSPSTPSRERAGLSLLDDGSPATPSRPPRNNGGHPGSTSAISRTFREVKIDDDDDDLPLLPQRLFGLGPKKPSPGPDFGRDFEEQEADSWEDDDAEVEQMLRGRDLRGRSRLRPGLSAMDPPEIPTPRPRPLQASSTQTSINSTASSSNSLFSAMSRTSSMSSVESGPRTSSPLKRGAEAQQDLSASPSKSRKLCETQSASSQSPMLERSPSAEMSSPHPSSSDSFSLHALFGGMHGSALEKYEIAHSTEVQKLFDARGVALGVQWELARGVTTGKWTWDQIATQMETSKQMFLGTNSKIAWKVPNIMRGREVSESESCDLAVWNEIDREHRAMQEGKSRGLGLIEEPWEHWDGQSSYYGGQIEYPLRLTKTGNPDQPYKVCLEKPKKGRSHRFARDLGSPSILHLSIPPKLVQEEGDGIRAFLVKRFIINGRVYVPIPPKDVTSVYLIQTKENHERKTLAYYGDKSRISFDEFVQRHNPLDLNSQQPFSKWTARWALGLSTSVPVLEFEKENILSLPDIYAEGWDADIKPPAEKIMTDGSGWINRAGLLAITKRVGYPSLPTAVQGRIGGAKGLWSLHPTDEDDEPRIWIRDSQLKIQLSGDHRVHRIFDLLRASRPSQTDGRARLSEQSILCLSHNGIPDDVLASLLVAGLEATVKPLLNWAPGAMGLLWRAVEGMGSVSGTRMQRIVGSKSRVLGFRDREPDEVVGDAELVDTTTSSRSGRDRGGGPLGLHEQAIELIQAGFHPASCAYLNDKLRYIIDVETRSVIDKYRISLPESTASEAFVIPDPLGVLKENEIYYRSSNPMKNPTTQTLFQTLKGPVIVGRYPMRLPCDMQLVTAVDIPELHNWPDVVIASTAGKHSLLSLLGGGDYDGDTVVFIWLDEFCQNFGPNQPLTPAPEGFMLNFNKEVKTVEQVGEELRCLSPEESQRAFQGYLLNCLRDSQVGLYSYFHDNAIYRHGYDHANAVLMAYIGNTLLDAGKTGLCLKNEVFLEHQRAFGHKRPKNNNWIGPPRDSSQPFILQTLSNAGNFKRDQLLREHDLASGKLPERFEEFKKDDDLLKPYLLVKAKSEAPAAWASFYLSELEEIKRHVDSAYKLYRQIYPLKEDKAQRATLVLSAQEKFAEAIPKIEFICAQELEQAKASYAYGLKEEFGFTVAFNTLITIKARASPGGMAANCRVFDELKTISGAASRAVLDDDDDV